MASLKHLDSGKRIITAINYACTHGVLPEEQQINSIDTQPEYIRYQLDQLKSTVMDVLEKVTLKQPRANLTDAIRKRQGLPPLQEEVRGPNLEWLKDKGNAERVLRTIKATCEGRKSEINAEILSLKQNEEYAALLYERDGLAKEVERFEGKATAPKGSPPSKTGGEIEALNNANQPLQLKLYYLQMKAWGEIQAKPLRETELQKAFKVFQKHLETNASYPYDDAELKAALAEAGKTVAPIGMLDDAFELDVIVKKPRFGIGKTTTEERWIPSTTTVTGIEVLTKSAAATPVSIPFLSAAQRSALEPYAESYGVVNDEQEKIGDRLDERTKTYLDVDARYRAAAAKVESHPNTNRIRDLEVLKEHYSDVASSITAFMQKEEKDTYGKVTKPGGDFGQYQEQSGLEKNYRNLLNDRNKAEGVKKEWEGKKSEIEKEIAARREALYSAEQDLNRRNDDIRNAQITIEKLENDKASLLPDDADGRTRIDHEIQALQDSIADNKGVIGEKGRNERTGTLQAIISSCNEFIERKEKELGVKDSTGKDTNPNSVGNKIAAQESALKKLGEQITSAENEIRDNIAKSYNAYQGIIHLINQFGDPATGVHARDVEFSRPKLPGRKARDQIKTDVATSVPVLTNVVQIVGNIPKVLTGAATLNPAGLLSVPVTAVPLAMNHFSDTLRNPDAHKVTHKEVLIRGIRDGATLAGGAAVLAGTVLSGGGLLPVLLVGGAGLAAFGTAQKESRDRIGKFSDYNLKVGAIEADELAENMDKVFGNLSKDKVKSEKQVTETLRKLSEETNLKVMDGALTASGEAEKAAAKGTDAAKTTP